MTGEDASTWCHLGYTPDETFKRTLPLLGRDGQVIGTAVVDSSRAVVQLTITKAGGGAVIVNGLARVSVDPDAVRVIP